MHRRITCLFSDFTAKDLMDPGFELFGLRLLLSH
jgi:hypothetical protein